MAEGGAADLDTQRSDIATLLKTSLRKGDTWYLVDSRWFKQWKKYVGFDSWDKYQMGDQNVYPGPIDNSGLLKEGTKISWYNFISGLGPPVVEQGMFVKHCKVEVYLTELKLCENGNMNNVVTRRFSKADTIDTIEKEIRKIFNIPDEKETRLWNKYMSNTFEPLNKPDSTIQDAGLYQGQVLVIEQKNEDGTWPRGPSTPKNNEQPGLCGLSNLGNTCFMNSAIQCLSNTPPLTEYFLNDKYQEELNFDNPLGMRGEIAKSYAELIKQMWSGKFSYVTPRAFKTQVGRFAPQFSGYQQQDCQELLAFLLDGLHEDLNRIRKKPYIQLKDADGRPDKVVAEEAWENHLKRNDSIIVDIFHGLFKSTLVCPECAKISVTFDPFCYLTLPLPMKKERTLEVYLVRMDPLTKPMQYKVVVPKIGNILDLCTALSALSGIPADKMIVTDIYNHRFHRIFAMDENLSSIMERDDIYVFEININRTEDTEHVIIPVCLREKFRHSSYTHHTGSSLFGQPFLMAPDMSKYLLKLEETEGSLHCCSPSKHFFYDESRGQDQELSLRQNETSSLEDSVGRAYNDSENGLCTDAHLQRLQLTADTKRIVYIPGFQPNLGFDDRQLRLGSSFLALDWDPDLQKKRYFDGKCLTFWKKHDKWLEYKPPKKPFGELKDSPLQLFTTKRKARYCPNCKEHQQATKKLDLWSLPPVLVVHLKRFSYSRYMRDKLDTLVDFPINDLDMSEFLINPNAGPCRYNLIAVSNHYGGMGGGHYTAFAKNKDDGKWYYFDDSSVSTASEDQIVSKAAYVLFYQRQDTFSGTGFFPLDRETKGASAATGIPLESDEDSNDNDNDIENENCMHTN
uniref:Ubiquitin carboxyl-terminal hydrolase n=1 Tax=Rhinopithecus bieti TaxID=61621 RepID=A0A2K6MRQ4_RHIBE